MIKVTYTFDDKSEYWKVYFVGLLIFKLTKDWKDF